MNQQQYDEEYEAIQREIRGIDEKQKECQLLERKIFFEEEENERDILTALRLNEDIECDWESRNLLKNEQHLFEDENFLLRKITSERKGLEDEEFCDLRQYRNELGQKKKECQENLLKLRKEYEETKEEDNDGAYY